MFEFCGIFSLWSIMLHQSDIWWLACAAVFLGVAGLVIGSPGAGESPLPCPGKCIPLDDPCQLTSGINPCGQDQKCCLDEGTSDTGVSTEAPEIFTYNPTIESEMKFRSFLEESDESTESPLSTPVYEEAFSLPDEDDLKCPGMCMPAHQIAFCGYPFPYAKLCNNGTCCLNELQAFQIRLLNQKNASGEISEGTAEVLKIFQAGTFGDLRDLHCPYNCLLPKHIGHCEALYPNYYCPGLSKCCVEVVPEPEPGDEKCEGRCLPPHLQDLCRPPRNLITSPFCRHPTLCCEFVRNADAPPRRYRQPQPPFYVEDQNEQYFYVSGEGSLTRLRALPPDAVRFQRGDPLKSEEDGRGQIYLIENPESSLWERYQIPFSESASEDRSIFRDAGAGFRLTPYGDIESDEILIPEEEDLEQEPEDASDFTARPPCPGSCVSYLTRFLCFRNYTTYDGFHCPGRSVCCAKLEDIKQHENQLRSIYPYLQSNFGPLNPNCGKKGRNDESPASLPGEWCWQVAIIDSGNNYVCGGALIEKSWVITSGQCVAGFIAQSQVLFVRAGATDLASMEDNAMAQTRRVLNMYLHYNFDSVTLDNDIALLKLQNPLDLNTNICLACLPSRTVLPPEGTQCTLTGYGFISRTDGMSFKLTETQIPLVHDMDCISNITEALATVYLLPASSFCGGHEKDYCQGASGNPLVCKVDAYYELTGLVSWGIGCEVEDSPGIYVKIPALMGWINHIIATDHQLYSDTLQSS